jgi:hypothetical protein
VIAKQTQAEQSHNEQREARRQWYRRNRYKTLSVAGGVSDGIVAEITCTCVHRNDFAQLTGARKAPPVAVVYGNRVRRLVFGVDVDAYVRSERVKEPLEE